MSQFNSSFWMGEFRNVTGTVWITGGHLTATNAVVGVGMGGVGRMSVSNGTVLASTVYVGYTNSCQGTLTVAEAV